MFFPPKNYRLATPGAPIISIIDTRPAVNAMVNKVTPPAMAVVVVVVVVVAWFNKSYGLLNFYVKLYLS